MFTTSSIYWIVLCVIVANTFAAPTLRERRNVLLELGLNPGMLGMEALNRAIESMGSGKPNWNYRVDPAHPGGMKEITNVGGGLSGGAPVIYNGPNQPAVAIGGAVSGSTGSAFGQRYHIGPDFGIGVGASYPIGTNGGSIGFGGGATFGNSYDRPQWAIGTSLRLPFGRKK